MARGSEVPAQNFAPAHVAPSIPEFVFGSESRHDLPTRDKSRAIIRWYGSRRPR
jgi:hypothetical protein